MDRFCSKKLSSVVFVIQHSCFLCKSSSVCSETILACIKNIYWVRLLPRKWSIVSIWCIPLSKKTLLVFKNNQNWRNCLYHIIAKDLKIRTMEPGSITIWYFQALSFSQNRMFRIMLNLYMLL